MKKSTENPFKTPENYFDSFQDRLMDTLSEHKTELPNNAGFKVPNDYFETFQDKLTNKVQAEKETKVVQLYPSKKLLTIAASIAAIVLIFLGLNWNTAEEVNFNSLANTDIEAYFDDNELDISTYDILEVLPLESMEIADIIDYQIKDENIIDYLNENLDHFEDLNIQDHE